MRIKMNMPKQKKEKEVYKCPHCDGVINPARMLTRKYFEELPLTPEERSEYMRSLVNLRWQKRRNRLKLYGINK